jgi:hypothetical protein
VISDKAAFAKLEERFRFLGLSLKKAINSLLGSSANYFCRALLQAGFARRREYLVAVRVAAVL